MPSRSRILLGAVFIGAGLLHFLKPRPYESIMPEALPAHRELVYLSGLAEIARRCRRAGRPHQAPWPAGG